MMTTPRPPVAMRPLFGFLCTAVVLAAVFFAVLPLAYDRGLVAPLAVAMLFAVAMFGIGIATDAGAHLRPRFLDRVFPTTWEGAVQRTAHGVTALFFLLFAGLAAWMVAESAWLGERTEILRVPIWVLQSMILIGFSTNGLRFAIYAARPELAPAEEVDAALSEAREEAS